jgi:hypothetical protein
MAGSNSSRLDIDFGCEGSMDRAFICNLEQPGSLLGRQFSGKVNVSLDAIE